MVSFADCLAPLTPASTKVVGCVLNIVRLLRLRSAKCVDKSTRDLSALLRSGCFLQAETDVPALFGFQIENCCLNLG